MNLTRCERGHFFDKDRFDDCPHCVSDDNNINNNLNNNINNNINDDKQPTKMLLEIDVDDINFDFEEKFTTQNLTYDKPITKLQSKFTINKRVLKIFTKMTDWICFSCLFSLLPLAISILIRFSFDIEISLQNKLITELLYFGLTIAAITVREMYSLKIWKKEQAVFTIALFNILIVLIVSAIFFGIMTLNEMNLLSGPFSEKTLIYGTITLCIVSLITGTFVQIWEER